LIKFEGQSDRSKLQLGLGLELGYLKMKVRLRKPVMAQWLKAYLNCKL